MRERERKADLEDLVLRSEAGSLRRGVIVHGSDVLSWLVLLAVQVEAIATGPLPHVTEPRPRPVPLHLQTHVKSQLSVTVSLNRAFHVLIKNFMRFGLIILNTLQAGDSHTFKKKSCFPQ